MTPPIIQIYEIQTPEEARLMIEMGVDHIGSVVPSTENRHNPVLRDAISLIRRMGAVSTLIPLYADKDIVFDTLSYYQPHVVHFCDHLSWDDPDATQAILFLQTAVKKNFPAVRIMRSIPIGQKALSDSDRIMALARQFESISDFFLTDTVLTDNNEEQPENGFVGITGKTCDWTVAARLVSESRIPVILAGGISPENVEEGIRTVRPYGVDSCTCTNAVDDDGRPIRFKKDPKKVRALVDAVRHMTPSI
ncbi:phosphoribosylanthranilate isomerase [Desulfosarcina sp. OttesenSCG-928-A07]|nr:phosphoribosylanthranilate isomerase [Desulfosarcina sp. OttesenSCG-928-A07]